MRQRCLSGSALTNSFAPAREPEAAVHPTHSTEVPRRLPSRPFPTPNVRPLTTPSHTSPRPTPKRSGPQPGQTARRERQNRGRFGDLGTQFMGDEA